MVKVVRSRLFGIIAQNFVGYGLQERDDCSDKQKLFSWCGELANIHKKTYVETGQDSPDETDHSILSGFAEAREYSKIGDEPIVYPTR